MQENGEKSTLERRDLIRAAGALGLGSLVAGSATAAPGAATTPGGLVLPSIAALRPRIFRRMCAVTPSAIEGPFYLDDDLVKKDITEGKPGLPHFVFFLVVDAATCTPIPNAEVDLWHCDAVGSYSGFQVKGTLGENFLRGTQTTDANGIAWFISVYPGWYPGRTPHLHVKVRPTPQTELTTQVYFDDLLSEAVYRFIDPYTSNGQADTDNDADNSYTPETLMTVVFGPGPGISLASGLIIGVE